ncbi:MAG: hypothetical protein IT204_07910 [Fimbriimonadaceae bacterium]|nr:hypothetical protein [Fimbriimonadaceae bacterium]
MGPLVALLTLAAEPLAYPAAIYPDQPLVRPTTAVAPAPAGAEGYGFEEPCPLQPRRSVSISAGGDGQTDCSPALSAALASGADEVVFGPGRFLLRPAAGLSDEWSIVTIADRRGLLIRGQGDATSLVAGDPTRGLLRWVDCQNVALRALRVDYNPLPFTQGRVTAADAAGGSLELAVDPDYPSPAAIAAGPAELGGLYRLQQSADGQIRWPQLSHWSATQPERQAGGTWRLRSNGAGDLQPGDRLIWIARRVAQHAVSFWRCQRVWIDGLTVHASPGTGLLLYSTASVQIRRYADLAPTGSNRLLATNADGTFVHGCRDGLSLTDSSYLGQGDDCVNLHSPAWHGRSLQVLDPQQVVALGEDDFRAGDVLEVMDPAAGRLKGQVTVRTAARERTGSRLTLAPGLDTIGFDPATDRLYNTHLAVPRFRLARNYFGPHRGRTLLLQARDGVIEQNTCENAEGYGLVLSYGGTAWSEGVVPQRVTIRDNLFRNLTNVGLAAVIEIFDGASERHFRDLRIERNTFENPRKMAIRATGVDGLQLVDNRIRTALGRRQTWCDPLWWKVDVAVLLERCGRVELRGLELDDPNLTGAGVWISADCDPGDGVRVSGVRAVLPAGVPPVKDLRP